MNILTLLKTIFPKLLQLIKGWLANRKSSDASENKDVTVKKAPKMVKSTKLIDLVKDLYTAQGGKWDNDCNIFGIRNPDNMRDDVWNDLICLAVKTGDPIKGTVWNFYVFIGTCDPSPYWSSNKNRKKHGWATNGAAHLADGFQSNIWVVGKHRGYEALSQKGAKVKIWRDVNEDFTDNDEAKMRKLGISNNGYFGINLHHGNNAKRIGMYSAGCQVIRLKKQFLKFMKLIKENHKSLTNPKAKYSYLLTSTSNVPEALLSKLLEKVEK